MNQLGFYAGSIWQCIAEVSVQAGILQGLIKVRLNALAMPAK